MTAEKKPAGKWHAVLRDDGKRYVSVAAAAASVACPKSTVSAVCRDGSMVGGHYFSYEEDGRRYACTCKICGRDFGGAAKNAVYCSQECRDDLRVRNVREEWK